MSKTEEPKSKHDVSEVVIAHQSRLKNFIRRRVSNKEDADDILQEVFYQLAKADSLMNPIEQVSAWLYKVARNLIINRGKKKREEEWPSYRDDTGEDILADFSEILFSSDSFGSSPEIEYLRSLVWEELENALAELPVEQREVYEQTELLALSVKAIAEQTGVSVNTLLSRKHYAILHLRERLEELYFDIIS